LARYGLATQKGPNESVGGGMMSIVLAILGFFGLMAASDVNLEDDFDSALKKIEDYLNDVLP